MKFIDLNQQYQLISGRIQERMLRVFEHTQFILGPEVIELEKQLAEFVGVKHCVTVSSGTLALQVALMALNIGPGDEVITSPFSFFATVETILLLGAIPVFVDIDQKTYNMDPGKLEVAITDATKVIMPVSLYGQCADLTAINGVADRYGLPVIEDGAQSFGGTHWGKFSCGLTTIGCTSFFPSKPLGCYGDGGACFTNDDNLAERIRSIRHHGQKERYHHTLIGTNARFDSLQAAVLLEKLTLFRGELEKRQEVASWYNQRLKGQFSIPYIASENISAYAQYTIQVDDRDETQRRLAEIDIPTAVHYPRPLHQQPAVLPYLNSPVSCPAAEAAAERVLSLPFHPYLKQDSVDQICNELLSVVCDQSVSA